MERIQLTEHITFLPDGGSHHVWKFADGTVWKEETFKVSPVLFNINKPDAPWGMQTARERGITSVTRTKLGVEIG